MHKPIIKGTYLPVYLSALTHSISYDIIALETYFFLYFLGIIG